MTFTDEDLQRLKDDTDKMDYVSRNSPRLKGLIARLEAAEADNAKMREVLEAVTRPPYRDSDLGSLLQTLRIQADPLLKQTAWRKASGR